MKYTSPGFKSVTADTIREAAEIFASREARKRYGRTGHARTCNQNAYSTDGSFAEFSAFIGYTPAGAHNRGTTTGANFSFTVYVGA